MMLFFSVTLVIGVICVVCTFPKELPEELVLSLGFGGFIITCLSVYGLIAFT